MMIELGDVENIGRDSRKKVADLMIVVIADGEFQIMLEELRPHPGLDPRRHTVTVVDGPPIRVKLDGDQDQAEDREAENIRPRLGSGEIDDDVRDIADDERDHQHDRRGDRREEHVRQKQAHVGLIKREKIGPVFLLHGGYYTAVHSVDSENRTKKEGAPCSLDQITFVSVFSQFPASIPFSWQSSLHGTHLRTPQAPRHFWKADIRSIGSY